MAANKRFLDVFALPMSKKNKKNVTIKDIADLVGVHHSTVSRALSREQRSKISPSVVRKVEKAAEKLHYYPNVAASALKQNRSFAVGVLIPDLMNPVFPPIIRGIEDTLESESYMLITANTDDTSDKEWQALRMMRGRSIEGLIIATARREDPIVDECIQSEIPFVLVNRNVDRGGVNAVISDEDYGIRATLDHLTELGHKRIAYVAGPDDTSTGHERREAFANNMRLRGLNPDVVIMTDHFTIEEGKRALADLLASGADFTAVVAGNDLIALGCVDALMEAGQNVPEDVSVVGSNDMPLLSRMSPPLTTVRIPKYEMGAQAAKALLDTISGNWLEPVVVRLQPRLIVRNSTARAAR